MVCVNHKGDSYGFEYVTEWGITRPVLRPINPVEHSEWRKNGIAISKPEEYPKVIEKIYRKLPGGLWGDPVHKKDSSVWSSEGERGILN
jgi:hypothetical protein